MKRVTVTTTLTLCLLLAWAIGASHAATPWKLFGVYMESCSCDIPCPCAVGGEPTNKTCQGFLNWHIIQGFYGDVSLNDVNATIMVDIPGMTDEGGWTIATYVDDTASPEQIEAIQSIIQESLGDLIAEDLGVKSVPIDFGKVIEEGMPFRHGMSGDTYKWTIPEILQIESTLRRDLPSVPGFFGPTYYQAEAVVQTYNDYGREWDFGGKNSFQGRLVLPPEEPSDRIAGTIRTGASTNGGSVNPYTRTAVVANGADATISLIDLATRQVTKTIPVGLVPFHPALNPYTNIAVVSNNGDSTVSIVDLTTGTVRKTIPVGGYPTCPEIDAVRNIAVVPCGFTNEVTVIDLETDEVIKTIPVGEFPVCMHQGINPFTGQAIVTDFVEETLSVVDLEEGVELQRIPVGTSPDGPALNPYTNIAVTANMGSNNASIIDLTAGEVIATIPAGEEPICPMIPDPVMNIALLSNMASDTVSVINLNTLSVVDTIAVGFQPMCFITGADQETMTAMVSSPLTNEVVIIDLTKIPTATEDYSQTFFLDLESGLNMISLPLKPLTQRTARDLMTEIGATMAIKLDATKGRFVGFTEADAGDGFPIEGGQGYIVNVKDSKVVPFVGAAWTNELPVEAAPTLAIDSAWAFVVSGALSLSDDRSNFDGYTIQSRNLRSGAIKTDVVSKSGNFALASADLSRNSIVQSGDKLEIIATDVSGNIVSKVIRTIGADNIGKAYLNVSLKLGEIIPSQTALLQNYPNPFNPETWIPFALAEDASVTINIYGAKGNLVRRFDIGQQGAGVYTSRDRAIYWDGHNDSGERVASGIYFYQLRAGDFTAMRKLVIFK